MVSYTTDTLLVRQNGPELEVLLIQRGGETETGKWALPGGHVDSQDAHDFERAAARELYEETNIDIHQFPYPIHLRYMGLRENSENRWVGHTYWGLVNNYHDVSEARAGDDAKDLLWVDYSQFKHLYDSGQMAFDHGQIVEDVFKVLKNVL